MRHFCLFLTALLLNVQHYYPLCLWNILILFSITLSFHRFQDTFLASFFVYLSPKHLCSLVVYAQTSLLLNLHTFYEKPSLLCWLQLWPACWWISNLHHILEFSSGVCPWLCHRYLIPNLVKSGVSTESGSLLRVLLLMDQRISSYPRQTGTQFRFLLSCHG